MLGAFSPSSEALTDGQLVSKFLLAGPLGPWVPGSIFLSLSSLDFSNIVLFCLRWPGSDCFVCLFVCLQPNNPNQHPLTLYKVFSESFQPDQEPSVFYSHRPQLVSGGCKCLYNLDVQHGLWFKIGMW